MVRDPDRVQHFNNFHALRLIAATLVIYAHAYELSGLGATDLIARVGGTLTAGGIGVYMFFAISGYLLTESWHRDPHLGRFAGKRALRIVPAFYFTLLATIFVLGPATTILPVLDYFRNPATWTYLNGLLVFPVQYNLPGVFTANPYKAVVNGSIWTLGPELFCYIVLAALGMAFRLSRACVVLALAGCVLLRVVGVSGEFSLLFMPVRPLLDLLLMFLSGSLLWHFRAWCPPHWIGPVALVALYYLAGHTPWLPWVVIALLPYATLSVGRGSSSISRALERSGDWSYGTYLWAFPVQQTLMWLDPGMPFAAFLGLSVVLSFSLGALSWNLIEKRALSFKPVRAAP